MVWLYLQLKKTSVYRMERLWREQKELGMVNGKYTQGAMVDGRGQCGGIADVLPKHGGIWGSKWVGFIH